MSDKDERKSVIDFTKGIMDRIRDRCREIDPKSWNEIDQMDEIHGRTLSNGERKFYVKRKRDER